MESNVCVEPGGEAACVEGQHSSTVHQGDEGGGERGFEAVDLITKVNQARAQQEDLRVRLEVALENYERMEALNLTLVKAKTQLEKRLQKRKEQEALLKKQLKRAGMQIEAYRTFPGAVRLLLWQAVELIRSGGKNWHRASDSAVRES